MIFRVAPRDDGSLSHPDSCALIRSNWDDYGYKSTFRLLYFDQNRGRNDLGEIKIVQENMAHGYTPIPEIFPELDDTYASLGMGQDFYESLMKIEPLTRSRILTGLRDVAWDESRFNRFKQDYAFQTSPLRGTGDTSVIKYRNILHNRYENTPFHFTYNFPYPSQLAMEFVVTPYTLPPTNIHVIIGRNGIGKTTLLKNLTTVLQDPDSAGPDKGSFNFQTEFVPTFHNPFPPVESSMGFANLVTVAFSAFDDFPKPRKSARGLKYSYVGLRDFQESNSGSRGIKSPSELEADFVQSTMSCLKSTRQDRWHSTIKLLESDGIFANLGITRLIATPDPFREETAKNIFRAASSGHKIVLLALTRLVELVDERTLVLIDEPEAHLHPPLQGAFIRALSWLLSQRNGVAILATHSPVMLQEVPTSCTWLMFRGTETTISRPDLETFGENLSILTREVFRYELTESGFYTLLNKAASESDSPEETVDRFGGHLGTEGRAIARALWRSLHNA